MRDVLEIPLHERSIERAFGLVPVFVRAELVLGPRRELDAHIEIEEVVEEEAEIEAAEELLVDLVRRAEDVRVVLDEMPHAEKPVELARLLGSVQVAGLGEAQRQLAVAPERLSVD